MMRVNFGKLRKTSEIPCYRIIVVSSVTNMQEPQMAQTATLPPVVTPKELAEYGRTSLGTIYRFLQDPRKVEQWRAYRVGERWQIPSQVVLDIPNGSLALED